MQCALVLGDSQVKYFEKVQDKKTWKTLCYPGKRIDNVPEEALELVPLFDLVVLNLGTNNVPIRAHTPAVCTAFYDRLLKAIVKRNPYCDIIVLSVLPRGMNTHLKKWEQVKQEHHLDILNSKARVLNAELFSLCMRYEAAHFVDLWDAFWDVDTGCGELLANDGLHLRPAGVRLILQAIEEHGHQFIRSEEDVGRSSSNPPSCSRPNPASRSPPNPASRSPPNPASCSRPNPASRSRPNPASRSPPNPASCSRPNPASRSRPNPALISESISN